MRLAIISQSARIYSEIGHLEGFTVLAVDAYADADTQVAADEFFQWPALQHSPKLSDCQALFARLNTFKPDAVVIGSGFEGSLEAYEALCQRYPVYGNKTACLRQVKDPVWLKQQCDQQAISTPAISLQPPSAGDWVYKQPGQCGGRHVMRWITGQSSTSVTGGYWQAYLPGQPVGMLFLAQGKHTQLIGVHHLEQQLGGFGYAGAARVEDAALTQAAATLLKQLVPALGVVGLNSLDAIWHDGQLHVLEVNPRLSASMRLYAQLPLIQAHITSCQGRGVPSMPAVTGLARHCIAYASQEIDFSQLYMPLWVEDRPTAATIAAGEPVCSLHAEGSTAAEIQQALQDQKSRLEKLWGTYVCSNIEFNIH